MTHSSSLHHNSVQTAHNSQRQLFIGPPPPPLKLTPAIATDPHTDIQILWHIARYAPELRYWLIANEAATPELLEYVSQVNGPHVKEAFSILFEDDKE